MFSCTELSAEHVEILMAGTRSRQVQARRSQARRRFGRWLAKRAPLHCSNGDHLVPY